MCLSTVESSAPDPVSPSVHVRRCELGAIGSEKVSEKRSETMNERMSEKSTKRSAMNERERGDVGEGRRNREQGNENVCRCENGSEM